jgi:hypothetical protein
LAHRPSFSHPTRFSTFALSARMSPRRDDVSIGCADAELLETQRSGQSNG